jgi:hypothetical protein
MQKLANKKRRVVIGRDDPKLTSHAGLVLVAEVDRIVGVTSTIDTYVGSIKSRNRGLGAGGLVVSAAEMMLAGGDFMCDLDNQRADVAGRELRAVPQIPSSPTFIALSKRFDDDAFEGIERANGELVSRWFDRLDPERKETLVASDRRSTWTQPMSRSMAGRKRVLLTIIRVSVADVHTQLYGQKQVFSFVLILVQAKTIQGHKHRH